MHFMEFIKNSDHGEYGKNFFRRRKLKNSKIYVDIWKGSSYNLNEIEIHYQLRADRGWPVQTLECLHIRGDSMSPVDIVVLLVIAAAAAAVIAFMRKRKKEGKGCCGCSGCSGGCSCGSDKSE